MRIKCNGAKCFITEIEQLASGAINYFTAKFNFDNAWTIFVNANQLYGVFEGSDTVVISNLIYNAETQTYDCEVPWQVITQEGELHIGAIGHITTPETIILTTNMTFAYRVPKGAATTGSDISDPSGLLLNILEASDTVQENVEKVNIAISHWPIIDPTTQNWFRWNTLTEAYVNTGTSALGKDGKDGKDLVILGHYNTLSLLQEGVLIPKIGDVYSVGTTLPYTAYIYDGITSAWVSYGTIFSGGGGSTEGLVTQIDFDAHVDSPLMHKPAVECTVTGIASAEGYKNTAGYLGVYYQTPDRVINTITSTAIPNEFIITFAETKPFAVINEPVKVIIEPSWSTLSGTVIGLGAQTITVRLTGVVPPDNTVISMFFPTQSASSYAHVEGEYSASQGEATHAEGSYTLAISGDIYNITDVDDATKTITLVSADGLFVGDLLHIKALSSSRDMMNPLLLIDVPITAINDNEVTLNTTQLLTLDYSLAIKRDSSYGSSAHVEGTGGAAIAPATHSEGYCTLASGPSCHAEGNTTIASGFNAHAQGLLTKALGECAHTEGDSTVASGYASHAQGTGTVANGDSQTALGMYNIPDSESLLIIGNGQSDGNRSNVLAIGQDGWIRTSGAKTVEISTSWIGGPAPYTQEIFVDGIDINDEPIIYPIYSEDNAIALLEQNAWNMISDIKTDENKIIVRCLSSLPDTAINIRLKGGNYTFTSSPGPIPPRK